MSVHQIPPPVFDMHWSEARPHQDVATSWAVSHATALAVSVQAGRFVAWPPQPKTLPSVNLLRRRTRTSFAGARDPSPCD